MCRGSERNSRVPPNRGARSQSTEHRQLGERRDRGIRYRKRFRVVTSSCPREFVNYKRRQAGIIAKHRRPNKVHCGTLGDGYSRWEQSDREVLVSPDLELQSACVSR